MKICEDCYAQNQDSEQKCTKCGGGLIQYQAPTPAKKNLPISPKILAIVGAVILVAGIGVGASMFLGKENNTSENSLSNSTETNQDPSNSTQNQLITVAVNGKYVGTDINLENRLFSDYDFSVATSQKAEDCQVFLLKNSGKLDYKKEMIGKITKILANESIPSTSDEPTVALLSQILAMQVMIISQYQQAESQQEIENISEYLEELLVITEELHEISGKNITQTSISLNASIPELNLDYNTVGEIYTVPYPENDNEYFDVFFMDKDLETADFLAEIEIMMETFIYDVDLIEVNEAGKSKFAAPSFTAFADQKYFPNTTLFPYLKSNPMTDFNLSRYLELDWNQEELQNLEVQDAIYISSEFTSSYSDVDPSEYELIERGEHLFYVAKKEIATTNGSEEMIVGFLHKTDSLNKFETIVALEAFGDFDIENHEFQSDDVAMINEIFQDIINTYEVQLSSTAKWYVDMANEMDAQFEENKQQAYLNKLAYSEEIDTGEGFTVRYDPNSCRLVRVSDVYPSSGDDSLRGIALNNTAVPSLIFFVTVPHDFTLTAKEFCYPDDVHLEKMTAEELAKYENFVLESEVEEEIIQVGEVEMVKRYERVTEENMNKLMQLSFNSPQYYHNSDEAFLTYSVVMGENKYVAYYSYSTIVYDAYNEMEFMMSQISIS